jgi:hypothetical protein
MNRILWSFAAMLGCAAGLAAQNAGGRPNHNEAERLANY